MRLSFRYILLVVLSFLIVVSASIPDTLASIYICNSTGHVTETFYTNDTIYMTGNISRYGADVEAYLVSDKNDWTNGTSFEELSINYWIVTTNSTGGIPIHEIDPPGAGSYDVAIDVDDNGIYNKSIDAVDSLSTVGFKVIDTPKPILTVKYGSNHPADHSIDLTNMSEHSLMMQMNFSASIDEIMIDTLSLIASGSGEDKEDIKIVYLILDSDSDGIYDVGIDGYLDYQYYLKDDGVVLLDPDPDLRVSIYHDITLMITYSMGNTGQVNEEYKFNLMSITARPANVDESVKYSGFPLKSAKKKISVAAIEDIVDDDVDDNMTNATITTTTIKKEDECKTDNDCIAQVCQDKQMTTLSCEYDKNKGINVCKSIIAAVDCCEDEDCPDDELCVNQECMKKKGLFGDLFKTREDTQEGEGEINTIYIIAIVLVIVVVVAAFLYMRNRNKSREGSLAEPTPPSQQPSSGSGGWDELRKKA